MSDAGDQKKKPVKTRVWEACGITDALTAEVGVEAATATVDEQVPLGMLLMDPIRPHSSVLLVPKERMHGVIVWRAVVCMMPLYGLIPAFTIEQKADIWQECLHYNAHAHDACKHRCM